MPPPAVPNTAPRFLRAFLLTAALAALLLPLLTLLVANYSDDPEIAWIQSVYVRKDLAVDRAHRSPGPTLMILGGSSGLFGIDASLIQRKLRTPTVNYATHAGLGLRYLLDRANRHLRPGDTALLCLEYALCTDESYCLETRRRFALTADHAFLAHLPPATAVADLYTVPLADFPSSLAAWYDHLAGNHQPGPYTAVTMSTAGDLHYLVPARDLRHFNPVHPMAYDPAMLHLLANFCASARANHVRLLAAFPPAWLGDTRAQADQLLPQLTTAYLTLYRDADVPVIALPAASAYPRSAFQDTPYHLTPALRRIHTEHLIDALRPYFPHTPAATPATTAPAQGPIFLLASPDHHVTPGNLFPITPHPRFLALAPTATPTGFPDYITPTALAASIRQGHAVYFDDTDAAAKSFAHAQNLPYTPAASSTITLATLLTRYPNHIILLCLTHTDRLNLPPPANLPAPLKRFFTTPGHRAAIQGTGRYAQVSAFAAGPDRAAIDLHERDTLDHWRSPIKVRLRSSAPPDRQITLNDTTLTTPPGLTVVILDPDAGIVLAQSTFTAPTLTAWQLDALRPPAHGPP